VREYWDLSERERADVTKDQVEAFAKVELMTKGVTEPVPPELEDVEVIELPHVTYYGITSRGEYQDTALPMHFKTTADAAACIETLTGKAYYKKNDYSIKRDYAGQMEDFKIITIQMNDVKDINVHKESLTKAQEAKNRNKSVQDKFNTECREKREALGKLWADWYRVREAHEDYLKMQATLGEYAELCGGDRQTALRFLIKAHEREIVRDMLDWLGLDDKLPPAELDKPDTADDE
jgi:hypothetical protein